MDLLKEAPNCSNGFRKTSPFIHDVADSGEAASARLSNGEKEDDCTCTSISISSSWTDDCSRLGLELKLGLGRLLLGLVQVLEFGLVVGLVVARIGETRSRRLWAVESGERTRAGDVIVTLPLLPVPVPIPVPVPVIAPEVAPPMLGHDLEPARLLASDDTDVDSMMVV